MKFEICLASLEILWSQSIGICGIPLYQSHHGIILSIIRKKL